MDKSYKNRIYNRITYICICLLLLVTMAMPMLSLDLTIGANTKDVCNSVTPVMVMRVGLSDKTKVDEMYVAHTAKVREFVQVQQEAGKTTEEIEKMLLTNKDNNMAYLINMYRTEAAPVKNFSIVLLFTYIFVGILLAMLCIACFIDKPGLDIANIVVTFVMAILAIVSLTFSLVLKSGELQVYTGNGELGTYVFALAAVALAIVEVVQFFIGRRDRKVKESDVVKPFVEEK